jgi:hypothetical protein
MAQEYPGNYSPSMPGRANADRAPTTERNRLKSDGIEEIHAIPHEIMVGRTFSRPKKPTPAVEPSCSGKDWLPIGDNPHRCNATRGISTGRSEPLLVVEASFGDSPSSWPGVDPAARSGLERWRRSWVRQDGNNTQTPGARGRATLTARQRSQSRRKYLSPWFSRHGRHRRW